MRSLSLAKGRGCRFVHIGPSLSPSRDGGGSAHLWQQTRSWQLHDPTRTTLSYCMTRLTLQMIVDSDNDTTRTDAAHSNPPPDLHTHWRTARIPPWCVYFQQPSTKHYMAPSGLVGVAEQCLLE
jgi:hypothetical protein